MRSWRVVTVGKPLVYSPVVTETVAVRVSFHVRRAHRRGYVRFYGTVVPADPGAQVGFQLLLPDMPVNEGGTIVKPGTSTVGRSGLSCACATVSSLPCAGEGFGWGACVELQRADPGPLATPGRFVHRTPSGTQAGGLRPDRKAGRSEVLWPALHSTGPVMPDPGWSRWWTCRELLTATTRIVVGGDRVSGNSGRVARLPAPTLRVPIKMNFVGVCGR